MNSKSVLVNLVVALPAESKPLRKWFQLKPVRHTKNVYQSEEELRLLVTGMGRNNVKQSFGRLGSGGTSSQFSLAWLNVGIAGHRELPVGETMIANKISCAESAKSVFPTPVLSGKNYGEVITVDEPELDYPQNAAYDMEASAFWNIASSNGALDLIQCCKLVSDNPSNGVEKITTELIEEIFHAASEEIRQHVDILRELALKQQQLASDPIPYLEIASRIHLSVNQARQVRRLCQRFIALNRVRELENLLDVRYKKGRDFIHALHKALQSPCEKAAE